MLKRAEYAEAGIPEFWIVDPREWRITVLKLAGASYMFHGAWGRGQRAESALLLGFGVEIDRIGASTTENHG